MLPPSTCIEDGTLAVFAGGELDAADRARVEDHLATCDSCMAAVAAAALSLDPTGGVPEAAAPGLLGGRFELGALIARGGMGVVHQGHDRATGRKVAIKCLQSEFLEGADDVRQRFEREGQILRQLDHPNIVKMLTTVQDDERLHIVMEYVGGGCLRDLLRAAVALLPVARVVGIALELSDGKSCNDLPSRKRKRSAPSAASTPTFWSPARRLSQGWIPRWPPPRLGVSSAMCGWRGAT